MASTVPLSRNGITYHATHHHLSQMYSDPNQVARWPSGYQSGLDGFQRFVEFAELQSGEQVLDLACGVGLTGLLACEKIGGRAPSVYFVDSSLPMIREAKREAQRRHPDMPDYHFQRVDDIRDLEMCSTLLQGMQQPGGFDVILVRLFISHFTLDTQPALLKHLRTLLKPTGRLVVDWGVPSPSRAFAGGQPSDEMTLGAREVRITPSWGQLPQWKMDTRLDIVDFATMVTTGDFQRARAMFRGIIEAAGGTVGAIQETIGRQGTRSISQQIVARAATKGDPPHAASSVQQDIQRRVEWDSIQRACGSTTLAAVGQPKTFRVAYGLTAVVR